jgi:proteasome lid subunit RPN8/RPN11
MPRSKSEFPPVILERGCLLGMVMAAMEVHSRETTGLLVGKVAKRFIRGTLTECVVLEEAYPLQTAKRMFTFVMVGNRRAFERARKTAGAYGFEILGEFHSHPESYPFLTKGDKRYIREQIMSGRRNELRLVGNRWLEVVIGLNKKEYKRTKKVGWYPSDPSKRTGQVKGILRTEPKVGFEVKIKSWWVGLKSIKVTPLYYSVY